MTAYAVFRFTFVANTLASPAADVSQANEIAAGAEFQHVNTLRQKWGGPKGYKFYREFVDELLERISAEVGA